LTIPGCQFEIARKRRKTTWAVKHSQHPYKENDLVHQFKQMEQKGMAEQLVLQLEVSALCIHHRYMMKEYLGC